MKRPKPTPDRLGGREREMIDTIFALGCGKMFEGTPQQFWGSLHRLKGLADDACRRCHGVAADPSDTGSRR